MLTSEEELPPPQSMWAPQPVLLVIAMALGAITMWAVSPVFWLWFASKVATWTTGEAQITASLAALILGGVIATAIALGKLLGVLNRRHMRLTGLDRGRKHARAWNKSMRDSRETSRDRGLLEPIMFWSLGAAALAAMIFSIINYRLVLPG
jgi:DMSO reductase anchor subunit